MIILGIETSCDETAASVVKNGHDIKSNIIYSQVCHHAPYGGVIPELAAREHIKNISVVVNQALSQANIDTGELDAIAATYTPGLLPALMVGLSYAKGMAASLSLPFQGINHFLAHIFSAIINTPAIIHQKDTFPIIALIVSGGHTALIHIAFSGQGKIIGKTLDDAAGEAFDKGAKMLSLGYPGGPIIDRLAKSGNPEKYHFPRCLIPGKNTKKGGVHYLDFSFSGVKTSLLYHIKKHEELSFLGTNPQLSIPDEKNKVFFDTIASYQEAIVDALVKKTFRAVEQYKGKTIFLGGGVACNSRLRSKIQLEANKHSSNLLIASPEYCTDNAAMIAGLAYYLLQSGKKGSLDLGPVPYLSEGKTEFSLFDREKIAI